MGSGFIDTDGLKGEGAGSGPEGGAERIRNDPCGAIKRRPADNTFNQDNLTIYYSHRKATAKLKTPVFFSKNGRRQSIFGVLISLL